MEHEGGQPWFSIATVSLTTELPEATEGEAEPFISSVERIPAPGGVTALQVALHNDTTDSFIYAAAPDTEATAGDLQLRGSFGHLQTAGDRVTAARVVGGALRSADFALELTSGTHTGNIVRIDYDRNLVYVDADLPTDGRLQYQTVIFDNPEYSRNTAYTIHGITREGDLSVIDLGTQRIMLGQGTLDQDPFHQNRITSLTQHDYARGLTPGGGEFFAGKLLQSADGMASTRVISTRFAQPMEIEVESSEGFSEGDDFYFYDLQEGDGFVIRNWATVVIDETGAARVTSTDDVTLNLGDTTRTIEWR